MRRIVPLFALLAGVLVQQPACAGATAARPVELGRIDGLRDILLRDGAVVPWGDAGEYGIVMLPEGKPALAPIPAPPLDLDGDGAEDIVLPDQGRRDLHAVAFAGGTFRTIWRVPGRERIATSVVAADIDGNGRPDLVYGRADGSVWLLPL